jgi:hypothetical protein
MFKENRFGMVEFGQEKYFHDIIVHVDGRVEKRDKSPSKRKYGTSHLMCKEEIEELVKENPDALVIGCGQSGMLKVGKDARALLTTKNIDLVDLPTQESVFEYNKLKRQNKRVAAIIHVTC